MNYSENVIAFIERNIIYIDNENWDTLLDLIVTSIDDENYLSDEECLELYQLLKEIGINISRDIIDKVLLNNISLNLEDYFDNNEKGNSIYFIRKYFDTRLGLDLNNFRNLIFDHLDDLGIQLDDKNMIVRK